MKQAAAVFALFLLAASSSLSAQDSLPELRTVEPVIWREDGTDRDGADALEEISLIRSQRLDLNTASRKQLQELPGISDRQADGLIAHRDRFGPYICLEELQSISGITPDDIRRITPFVRIKQHQAFELKQAAVRQELILRLAGNGTVWNGKEHDFRETAGDGFRSLLRYRMRIDDHWTLGLRAEKDPGEAWLDGKNRPDYTSGFLNYTGKGLIRMAILGDFAVQYGQGALAWLGFGPGFTSDPAMIRRQARGILPYTSSDENAGLRGAAVSLEKKIFGLDLFVSHRKRDASISNDTLSQFSSLQTSGVHSTRSELAGKAKYPVTLVGVHGGVRGDGRSLGATMAFQHLPGSLSTELDAYARFRNFPEHLFAASIDGCWHWQNATLFFESAIRRGSHSLIGGLQSALGKKLNVGIQYRKFGKGPITLLSDAPAESMRNENEKGFVLSFQSRILPVCTLQVLLQKTAFDWLRYRIDTPSILDEQQVQLYYNPTRKTQFRARYRRRLYPTGIGYGEERITREQQRAGIRFSMTTSLPPFLSLETRFEHLRDGREKGWLAFTDWSIRPPRSSLQGTIRFALAETTSYTSAIYSQEPDVLYGFSMPGYYGSLARVVAVIKWRITRSFDLSIKNGWTRSAQDFSKEDPEGKPLGDLSVQLRWTQDAN